MAEQYEQDEAPPIVPPFWGPPSLLPLLPRLQMLRDAERAHREYMLRQAKEPDNAG